MLAMARTFSLIGIDAEPVFAEVDVARGLPSFAIVGLPDTAVRESRERVRAALVNSGFDFPMQRIITNLAPADLPKVGPGFDLAIAAGVLASSGQIPKPFLDTTAFAGELALDGTIRPVPGALAMAEAARRQGHARIAVARQDSGQAALVDGVDVVALDHVSKLPDLAAGSIEPEPEPERTGSEPGAAPGPDLRDLKGQPALRRALEIAAAGGHSLLLVGPPGAGKTLAARRLPSIMPALSRAEALEVIRIAGAAGGAAASGSRPFRAPHHTASGRALIGGGSPLRPGEVTRAHRGVLFLDELGEFRRDAIEALREPLEEGRVRIARAQRSIELPCRFTLVAASNPCPCGHGAGSGACECPPTAVARYEAKLSGALADRIDVFVGIGQPPADAMASDGGESSAEVRPRVEAARGVQRERLGEDRCNAEMTPAETRKYCGTDPAAEAALREGHDRIGLSGRGWDRVLRVSRTIADLDSAERIGTSHVAEALGLRRRSLA